MTCLFFILGGRLLRCLSLRLLGPFHDGIPGTLPALTGSASFDIKLLGNLIPIMLVKQHQHNIATYEYLRIHLEVLLEGEHRVEQHDFIGQRKALAGTSLFGRGVGGHLS